MTRYTCKIKDLMVGSYHSEIAGGTNSIRAVYPSNLVCVDRICPSVYNNNNNNNNKRKKKITIHIITRTNTERDME